MLIVIYWWLLKFTKNWSSSTASTIRTALFIYLLFCFFFGAGYWVQCQPPGLVSFEFAVEVSCALLLFVCVCVYVLLCCVMRALNTQRNISNNSSIVGYLWNRWVMTILAAIKQQTWPTWSSLFYVYIYFLSFSLSKKAIKEVRKLKVADILGSVRLLSCFGGVQTLALPTSHTTPHSAHPLKSHGPPLFLSLSLTLFWCRSSTSHTIGRAPCSLIEQEGRAFSPSHTRTTVSSRSLGKGPRFFFFFYTYTLTHTSTIIFSPSWRREKQTTAPQLPFLLLLLDNLG
jgi:hypothetical protein